MKKLRKRQHGFEAPLIPKHILHCFLLPFLEDTVGSQERRPQTRAWHRPPHPPLWPALQAEAHRSLLAPCLPPDPLPAPGANLQPSNTLRPQMDVPGNLTDTKSRFVSCLTSTSAVLHLSGPRAWQDTWPGKSILPGAPSEDLPQQRPSEQESSFSCENRCFLLRDGTETRLGNTRHLGLPGGYAD